MVGFATTLGALSGTNCAPPTSAGACLIDTQLATGVKSGYLFAISGTGNTTPISAYQFQSRSSNTEPDGRTLLLLIRGWRDSGGYSLADNL